MKWTDPPRGDLGVRISGHPMYGHELRLDVFWRDSSRDEVSYVSELIVKTVKFRDSVEAASDQAPLLTLNHPEAQSLLDQLWNAGVRPSSGVSSAGQLESMRDHLDTLKRHYDGLYDLVKAE